MAGTVASHNRAGQYFRNRRAPVQPVGTGRRAFIRAAFGAASSAWGALPGANQAAWIAYANEFPVTDALGQSITLTGHQAFVSIYVQCINCSIAVPALPPVSNAVFTPSVLTFQPNETTTPVFTPTFTAAAAGSFLCVALSQQFGAGVNFNATWWQQEVIASTAVSTALLTNYVAHFGILTTGKKIFGKFTPVNASGVTGVPVIVSNVVT